MNQRHACSGLLCSCLAVLVACSGGGGSAPPQTTTQQMGGSIQGKALQLTPTVGTFAGTPGGTDGTGGAARFDHPMGLASDGTYLYVADRTENKIRRVQLSTGAVSTLAGSGAFGYADGAGTAASFSAPVGLVCAGTHLYVTDYANEKIRVVATDTGQVTSLTGAPNARSSAGAQDGAASVATFNGPQGLTTDGTYLYVADSFNQKIRKVALSSGAVSSLTGAPNTAGPTGAADGAGPGATFYRPTDIATDGTNLYVTDAFNNKIRKIVLASAWVSSFTGAANTSCLQGAADGPAASAGFDTPCGLACDGTNLYVVDEFNNKIRQIVLASGVVSSLTGVADAATKGGAADGAGPASSFLTPMFIVKEGTHLYVTDTANATLRRLDLAGGTVDTLAGTAAGADGKGQAASFRNPGFLTSDGTNLYVADFYNNKIRKVVLATGAVTTLAGSSTAGAADGAGSQASFNGPLGITTDGTNVYVTDVFNHKLRQIVIATGMVSSLTGTPNTYSDPGVADGPGSGATFDGPTGLTTDGANLYVVDANNYKIRKLVLATGMVSSVTGAANLASAPGAVDGPAAGATFNGPGGITTDGANLYVADENNNKIRKLVLASGMVSSLTGTPNTANAQGSGDGPAASAMFSAPLGITSDGTNLFVADIYNNKVRKLVLATGVVSSLTGAADAAGAPGTADGPGATATFNGPNGITTDGLGLYVADTSSNTLRRIQ